MKNSDTPANPTTYMDQTNGCGELYSDNAGLTKREAFAMAAMQGLLASKYYGEFCDKSGVINETDAIALVSVNHADALLKQLEAK